MKTVNKTPIWFMRQAGRYLPEYRKIRTEKKNFLDLCFSPKLAASISLQPIERFDLDFIILFSDILVIPHSLNQKVVFKERIGPVLNPIKTVNDLDYKNFNVCLERISAVFETIEILKKKKGEKKLIGFCGGPFTVMNYMIEGGISVNHKKIKDFIRDSRQEAKSIINMITEISIEYLKRQILSGVDFVQVFESWAGLLEEKDFEEFIIKPNALISKKIKEFSKETQIIHFPRGAKGNILKFLKNVYCDVISLDEEITEEAMEIIKSKDLIIQGNLHPMDLFNGGEKLQRKILKILRRFKKHKHIFNLSHGILPKTPIENVERTVKIVRDFNET